jgi:hypothetical protein
MQTLLQRTRADLGLRSLSVPERLALGAITAFGLLLRAGVQWGRLFTGDEIGTLINLQKSAGYLLTHFGGWLTMNYFILAEKAMAWLCGATDWRLTLLPLAASIAIIPLTASLALKFTGSARTALIAASLVAFNPFLVAYGPVIRAYSPLAAFSLLAINEFFHWSWQRNWWNGGRCAAAVLLLLLVHLDGVYTIAFLALLLVIETISAGRSGGRKFLWESKTLWAPLIAAGSLSILAYWHLLPGIARFSVAWSDTPPTSLEYLPLVFRTYFGAGYYAFLFAALLLLGIWSATQEHKPLLLLCAAVALGPVLMSLHGLSHFPWAYSRFLIFSLPLLLILLAEGINWLAAHILVQRRAAVGAWALAGLIVLCWAPDLVVRVREKDYRTYARMADSLRARFQSGDVILTSSNYYFGTVMTTIFGLPEELSHSLIAPRDYVNKLADHLDAPVTGRVSYLAPAVPGSPARQMSVQRFGQLEITTYGGNTARALLENWREDLLRRADDRIDENLQDDYELLALIEERLPSGQSPDHWRLLAERCRELSPAARHIPPQILRRIPEFAAHKPASGTSSQKDPKK